MHSSRASFILMVTEARNSPDGANERNWSGKRARAAINSLVVVAAVSFACISFVNVDAEIARGWTWYERLLRLTGANWEAYELAVRETPIATKTAINAIVYALAEWISQVMSGRRWNEFDLKRVLSNSAIGAFFGPLVCGYYDFSDTVLPPQDAANVPWKILMDQTIYCTVKYSAYLSLSGVANGRKLPECMDELQAKLWPTLTTGWKFWPAVHLITYNLIPPRHRVLWINLVDLAWVTFLSTVARQTKISGAEEASGGRGPAQVVYGSAPPRVSPTGSPPKFRVVVTMQRDRPKTRVSP